MTGSEGNKHKPNVFRWLAGAKTLQHLAVLAVTVVRYGFLQLLGISVGRKSVLPNTTPTHCTCPAELGNPNPPPSPQIPCSKLSFSWLDLMRTAIWWPTLMAAQPHSGLQLSSRYFSYGKMLTENTPVTPDGVSQQHPQPQVHAVPQTQSTNLLATWMAQGTCPTGKISPPGFHLRSSVSH